VLGPRNTVAQNMPRADQLCRPRQPALDHRHGLRMFSEDIRRSAAAGLPSKRNA
jgi:hypothetical protein